MYGMSICYLKKKSILRHAHFCFRRSKGEKAMLLLQQGRKGQQTKKTRAKKGNPIKTSVSRAGVVTFAKHISAAPE